MSEAVPTPAAARTPEAYPLRVGDEVFDIKQLCDPSRDTEPAVVIGIVDETVHEATFTNDLGEEVVLNEYEPNTRFADFTVSERVVTIAWETWLDNNVPRWDAHRDDPTTLMDYLATCEKSWGIPITPVGSFDYPESRLALGERACPRSRPED